MSIKYNGEIIAGKYKTQIIPQADTLNSGIIKIATDTEIEQGTNNTTAVTPLHLSLKQDKLIAGDNIFIDENLIECEIYPDDTTIIQNDDNTFTTIAHKTKSGTIKIDWEGTNAEYESGLADGTISKDWYCYITDDEQVLDYKDYVTNDTLESSNIYTLGENKLSDIKAYTQLKSEYDNGEEKVDILVPDNYKIIGSPLISSDGILSQTSVNDYIYKNGINFNGKEYEITLNFTLSNLNPQNDYTLLFLNCGNIYDNTSAFFRSWVSSTGQLRISYTDSVSGLVSTEPYNLDLNKTYTIKIGYDYQNDQMYQKIFDNNGMMLTFQYINLEDYVENFMTGNLTLVTGYGINGGLENTTIDLNSLKIKSDNKVLYTPLLKIPYILSKQGSKIVNIEYQYRVLNWYEINGETEYYIIDTINEMFYLPLVNNVLNKVLYNEKEIKNNTLNKSQITNCITEIPQDIKLELNDGVLTLKAGSKVYVPNGFEADGATPKFDEVVIESDLSDTYIDSKPYCFFSTKNGTSHTVNQVATCNSGNTDTGTGWHVWYNTSTNKIIRYNGDGEIIADDCSLPVCIYSGETTITSIDQTFNGFGYIGSTVFVTKGVKGLIPNGRNDDGTLNNIEYTTDKVVMETYGSTVNADTYRYLVAETSVTGEVLCGSTFWSLTPEYINSSVQPPTKNYTLWYDTKNNVHKRCINSEWHNVKVVKFGQAVVTSGTITSFTPKLPFRAIDYNDKSTVSSWSMPSSKYIDLTLGASQSTYTAPANGWYVVSKTSTASGQYINMINTTNNISIETNVTASGNWTRCYLPVKKGDKISIAYSVAGTTNYFRFVYAEGEI